ncbi:MAG TPA: hypothetical protein VM736_07925 [Gemmatimonadales bacterium]|nr:hypothetical protein [Gemmatimonadales bacterium]
MRALWIITALVYLGGSSAAPAQRRIRLGPTYGSLSLEDASGTSHSFSGFGGAVALITGDDGETGIAITRYSDLSTDNVARSLTLFAFDSYYYPVGTRGALAPFATTTLGLARVSESSSICVLLSCRDTVSTMSHFALAFGLGLRVNLDNEAAATVTGRFLQVPGTQIQGLEAVANASITLGAVRRGSFLEGTAGPAVGALIPVSGALRARAPFVGARFRRDKPNGTSLGLQLDFAPLELTGTCPSTGCDVNAILFAPGYEASVRPPWGRLYGEVGLLLAGVYSQGPDRGIAEGAHGGIGVDLDAGALLWNFNSRLLWLQRRGGDNVFGIELGVSLSLNLGHPKAPK